MHPDAVTYEQARRETLPPHLVFRSIFPILTSFASDATGGTTPTMLELTRKAMKETNDRIFVMATLDVIVVYLLRPCQASGEPECNNVVGKADEGEDGDEEMFESVRMA